LVGKLSIYEIIFPFFFEVNIGIGQGFALSPILSVLYLSSFFYIFEKHAKNLKIPVFLLSFVDDSLLFSQENFLKKPICFFSIVTTLFLLFWTNLA